MAQYCDNFTFLDNDNDSFEFWNGLRGPAGPAGAPGAPGTSVELRGPVASTSELPASAPSSELWMVGDESPYEGYFWNGSAWIDAGHLMQGPQGEPGEDGADGVTFSPTVSSAGVISWTNDGGLPNPDPVDIKGPQGPQGATGQTGPQGETGATGPAGPGVPSGGSTGQVLKKKSATDYDTEWSNAGTADALPLAGGTMSGSINMDGNRVQNLPTPSSNGDAVTKSYADGLLTGYRTASAQDVIDAAQDADIASRAKTDMLGIVINGNSTPVGASVGQYVIVKNSTISGITDGLYKAAQAIPANTAIDSTYLAAVSEGGLNDLKSAITKRTYSVTLSPNEYVSPFTFFGQTTDPISDIALYGSIISLISKDNGMILAYDDPKNRIAATGLSSGTKTFEVVFCKNFS